MDKLVLELVNLLREMLLTQQRILQVALARQEAMKAFDVERLTALIEQERIEAARAENFDRRRQILVQQFKAVLGPKFEPTVSEIARRCSDPRKSELLGLAGQLKAVVEQVDRLTRINAKV